MLKGLAITPPILGRITIGKVVENHGKRLPQKDDQFTITSQLQTRDGWLRHPLDEALRSEQEGKLRRIPIRLLFNDPDLNLRAEYALFDRQTARPLCVGDGEQCKRRTREGMETLPCPAPDACPLAQGGACKPYGRLNVLIGDDDPLGSFIFRTTGFNSIRTLAARLAYFKAVSGNRLACLPLELRLRGKSTRQSRGTPIFYVDITLREGWTLEDTLSEAQRLDQEREATGFDQKALDRAAKAGFANGAFEDSAEESIDVVEEFYPDLTATEKTAHRDGQGSSGQPVTLADKLQARSQQSGKAEATDKAESPAPTTDDSQQPATRQAKRA
ncbi:hydrolase or metal-binding protein [Modicisalibacter sp. 'Wilcox']|uniref:recombination directionality factor n=1 Tax=Modicisalibacter sp. 'Wilcox' TaxID=2679914 RepID=UPI001F08FC8B|nr:hydrolase or metal-binding protein [Modicisalibacter sp. 'Wilcox']